MSISGTAGGGIAIVGTLKLFVPSSGILSLSRTMIQ